MVTPTLDKTYPFLSLWKKDKWKGNTLAERASDETLHQKTFIFYPGQN